MPGSLIFLLTLALLVFSVYDIHRLDSSKPVLGVVLFQIMLYFIILPLPIMWFSYVLAPVLSTTPLTYLTSLLVGSVVLGLYFVGMSINYYFKRR